MKKAVCLIVLGICFLVPAFAQYDHPLWLNVVYIGNSITQGVLMDTPRRNAPPVKASIYLRQQEGVGEVKFSNQGASGKTTVDFLPETGTYFNNVKEAADQLKEDTWSTLIFSIMLGTNDSAIEGPNGAPVSPEAYYRNMSRIMDELLALYPGCLIVLHRPLWYSPNTHNASRYLEEGLERLQSYFPELDRLVDTYGKTHPGQVFAGDQEGFGFFQEHYADYFIPENGNSGTFYLHPNEAGATQLGRFWGKAIWNCLRQNE
ncbi:MAG: GDSL-type esterase/lipase family protein [Tannerellaceae bacterium]|nr:GDSL-type esterase/lipase family protein [Tannerellaceae bacterium]